MIHKNWNICLKRQRYESQNNNYIKYPDMNTNPVQLQSFAATNVVNG